MNILDIVKNYLPSNLASQLSQITGEREAGIANAIDAALPVLLSGVIYKSKENPSSMMDIAQNAAGSGVLNNLTTLVGRNESATTGGFNIWTALKSLFGSKLDEVIGSIAAFSGVKSSVAEHTLGSTGTAVLGAIGKHAADKNLDAAGLSSFLGNQKGIISSLIPAGFDFDGVSTMLGLGGLTVTGAAVSPFMAPPTEPISYAATVQKKGRSNWVIPVIILAAIALLAWWLSKNGCNGATTVENATIDTITTMESTVPAADSATTDTVATTREAIELSLPSGLKINAFKGGIEDQLIRFIQSDEYKNATEEQLKDRWFNFDNINFVYGTTKLNDSSAVQLNNIVAILKEFKDVKMKIGAYTDKKGNDQANLTLSQGRANTLKKALEKSGVGAQLAGAEGYGEQLATVPETESDEARAKDRKTAVRLVK